MSIEVVRDRAGREAYRVLTPSGVVGYIATEVPGELLRSMAAKLRRRPIRSGQLIGSDEAMISDRGRRGRWLEPTAARLLRDSRVPGAALQCTLRG